MESIFLGSFLFGLLMVLASVVLGFAHLALPGGHDGFHLGGDGPDAGPGHAHAGEAGHGDGHGHGQQGLPLWNVSSLLAFLMWFGAAGYVATRFMGLAPLVALIPALGFGLAGAALVSLFLGFVLRGEREMDPGQYRMEGTLARVTITIPADGTGEIVFTKGETRRSEGARSLDGRSIARGEEVVVIDYQRGIALVQRWQDFIGKSGPKELAEGSSR